MLVAQNEASPTEKTMEKVRQLLDYAGSHKEAVLTYHVSDMVLAVHSNVGYLNESKLRNNKVNLKFTQDQGKLTLPIILQNIILRHNIEI